MVIVCCHFSFPSHHLPKVLIRYCISTFNLSQFIKIKRFLRVRSVCVRVLRSLHFQWYSFATSMCFQLNIAETPIQNSVNMFLPHPALKTQPSNLRMRSQSVDRLQYWGCRRSAAGHFPPVDTS